MPGRCKFCRGKGTGAKAFLLTCSCCSASWHHNCHTPALSDIELTALLKASNRDDPIRGIQSWTCNRCLNQHNSTALVQGIITIDDSDDDIMIVAEKLTLPNPRREMILDLTMSDDDDGIAVTIVDNSPIVIDSDSTVSLV
ncbi:hypothetical protein BDN71DRAFT_1455885 [Pleurotus eryngii]|uniref:Zinc finger PHD-type domain-containing protein n=1 Tax=Pleurotus eryngii TaxID=5323 RepID=A0A9P5ZLP3_PLEER|nr:hypothetical protein BDN71DRAFT_1455885 [Pleurotus eryngii]